MGKVCIMCQAEINSKDALPVKEDKVITTIRAIKKKFGWAQMNELYICQNDLAKQAERRKSFERSMMISAILAGLILVVIIVSTILSGRLEVWAIVSALVLATAIAVLPLFKYVPAVVQPAASSQSQDRKLKTRNRPQGAGNTKKRRV